MAAAATRHERAKSLNATKGEELFVKASDWSEVRPEWGLSGNASFIVAPRSMSASVHLSGRSFLHSYDAAKDVDGSVLELIMTAPMVVASWINMQYYASTVDHSYFGCGSKTIHNVVGRFGVLSGNSRDLRTGLPWESIHDGERFQHEPLRLSVVIAAPRARIDQIIETHALVSDLVENGWLHLVAIDDSIPYRRSIGGKWIAFSPRTK